MSNAALEKIAADRADWLLDAVATATQDRQFLRGDPAYNEWAGEAILLSGKKAILIAFGSAAKEAGAAADTITDLLAAGMAVWNNVLNGDIECHTGQAAASLTTLKEAIARAKGGAA